MPTIASLQEENTRLRQALQKYSSIETDVEHNLIYGILQDGGSREACCKVCYDTEGRVVTLSKHTDARYWCNVCRNDATIPGMREQADREREEEMAAMFPIIG